MARRHLIRKRAASQAPRRLSRREGRQVRLVGRQEAGRRLIPFPALREKVASMGVSKTPVFRRAVAPDQGRRNF